MTLDGIGRETVSALKGQPLLLVVVLLNLMMLALIGYSVKTAQENSHAILQIALEKCGR